MRSSRPRQIKQPHCRKHCSAISSTSTTTISSGAGRCQSCRRRSSTCEPMARSLPAQPEQALEAAPATGVISGVSASVFRASPLHWTD
jgi:hypothetical protein